MCQVYTNIKKINPQNSGKEPEDLQFGADGGT